MLSSQTENKGSSEKRLKIQLVCKIAIFYGEFIDLNLDEVMESSYEVMHSLEDLTSTKLTIKEEKLFKTLLTDPTVRDVALLIARGAASIDSLDKREEAKYNHWAKVWGI